MNSSETKLLFSPPPTFIQPSNEQRLNDYLTAKKVKNYHKLVVKSSLITKLIQELEEKETNGLKINSKPSSASSTTSTKNSRNDNINNKRSSSENKLIHSSNKVLMPGFRNSFGSGGSRSRQQRITSQNRRTRFNNANNKMIINEKTKYNTRNRRDENEDSDEIISEDEMPRMKPKPRVERFLSIVEIPQDILYYTQQKFGMTGGTIGEEDEDQEENDVKKEANKSNLPIIASKIMENIAEEEEEEEETENDEKENKKIEIVVSLGNKSSLIESKNLTIKREKEEEAKKKLNKSKKCIDYRMYLKNPPKNNKKIKDEMKNKRNRDRKSSEQQQQQQNFRFFYNNGSSLSQQAKAAIIRDIIDNFDLDKYINEFKSKYYVEIELDKNKSELRPIRQRLITLMKSDVIRINDYDYMNELSTKIRRMQIEKQEELAESLREKERKRQTRLMIKGYISKPYDIDCETEDGQGFMQDHNRSREDSSINTSFRLPKLK